MLRQQISEKKIDDSTVSRIFLTYSKERMMVLIEYEKDNKKLKIEKNYANSALGKLEADEFLKTIKSGNDVLKYFGMETKENKKNVTKKSSRTNKKD